MIQPTKKKTKKVSKEELNMLYDHFTALDKDEDGKVTEEDFITNNLGAIMDDPGINIIILYFSN
jgi:Ca2+-binding EF-hand superfamily protein